MYVDLQGQGDGQIGIFLTVACNCSILVLTLYLYFSGTILISTATFALANLWNYNTFSHQTSHTCGYLPLVVHLIFFKLIRISTLDLEPNLDFQIFLNISKTNGRIFNCNIPNRRSNQVLSFILLELIATTCIEDVMTPKWKMSQFYCLYLLHIHSISKNILHCCIELPQCYISCSGW